MKVPLNQHKTMKTYLATLSFKNYDEYFMSYKFFDGDEEVGNAELQIDKHTNDYIVAEIFESDFCDTVEGKELKHTESDGEYYHGTWTESEPTS